MPTMPNGEQREFWDEARELMESGMLPEKVTQRLIWAAVAATYTRISTVAALAEKHEQRIIVLERVAALIGTAIIGLAIKVIFG